MEYIFDNDPDGVKFLNIHNRDLNYLIPFGINGIDSKISPLILASLMGRLEIVKMILSNRSVDIDLASYDNYYTPLAVATASGNYEVLKTLLQADPEVNKPSRSSRTPFVLSFRRLNEENNTFENKKICFMMATLLLEYGSDINWICNKNKGYTLLMELCASDFDDLNERQKEVRLEAIKFLVLNGADKHIKSLENLSAVDLAERSSYASHILPIINDGTSSLPQSPRRSPKRRRSIGVTSERIRELQIQLDSARHQVVHTSA